VSKELQEILNKLQEIPQSQPTVLATVVDVRGSSYRLPGARMLIDENGNSLGTISGGCLEADVLERARKVLQTGIPQVITYDTRDNENSLFGLQMGCNGVIRVLLEAGRDNHLLEFVKNCFVERRSGSIATLIAAPENFALTLGTRYFVGNKNFPDKNFKDLEFFSELKSTALQVLESRRSRCEIFQTPDGEVEFFVELIAPPISLFVFGAGFDARPVADFANDLGWRVSIIDHRSAFATDERFPNADEIMILSSENLQGNLILDENSAAVVMTHNYNRDREILRFLLDSKARYIGALGPKRRTEKLLEELKAEGSSFSAEQLEKLFAPVGLDIGAKTPEAIALSIIAEIQSVLNHREGGFLRRRKSSIYEH
jgi:xanthine/CO dehydrogenase XdhC/CoxF family maturation factor